MLIFQLCDLNLMPILSLSGKTGEVLDTKYFDMWGGGTYDLPCVPAADPNPCERRLPVFAFPLCFPMCPVMFKCTVVLHVVWLW